MKKVVLITGSSKGIGKAIALAFAKKNYSVVINCKSSVKELNETLNEIKEITPDVLAIQTDVSVYENCQDMYNQIIEKFGRLDVLVNNAGISYIGLFNEMELKDWKNILQTNFESAINLSHIVVQNMIKEKKGNIINISSIWGNTGASCEVIYSASKGGLNSFTKALAKELAPSGIRVNAIACGAIETEMNSFLSEEEKNTFSEEIPLMRFGDCEEVANMVLFLASEKSSYLTGQIVTLDGGLT